MKKVLIAYDSFNGIEKVWDASTKSLEKKAYLALFRHAENHGRFEEIVDALTYEPCELCDETGCVEIRGKKYPCPQCHGHIPVEDWAHEIELFNKAKKGVIKAIKQLLNEFDEEYAAVKIEKV
jgi:hypothetical protein